MNSKLLPSIEDLQIAFRLDSSVQSGLVWICSKGRVAAGSMAGSNNGTGHFQVDYNGSRYLTSRIIYQLAYNVVLQADDVIDHIDRNPLNNDSSNLRIATRQQNCRNAAKNAKATSQYRGVSVCSRKKTPWMANIRIENKVKFIGRYKTEIEAAEAYDKAARSIDPIFYKTNF